MAIYSHGEQASTILRRLQPPSSPQCPGNSLEMPVIATFKWLTMNPKCYCNRHSEETSPALKRTIQVEMSDRLLNLTPLVRFFRVSEEIVEEGTSDFLTQN